MPEQFGDARIRVTLDTSQLEEAARRVEADRPAGEPPRRRRAGPRPERSEDERLHDFLTGDRTPRVGRGTRSPRAQAESLNRLLTNRVNQAIQNYVGRIPVIGPMARSVGQAARGAGAARGASAASKAAGAGLSKAGAVGAILAAAKFAWDYGPQGVTLWPTGLAAFQGAGVLPTNPALEKAIESLRADFINIKSQLASIMPALSYATDATGAGLRVGGTMPNFIKLAMDAQGILAEEEAVKMKFNAEINDTLAENIGRNLKNAILNR